MKDSKKTEFRASVGRFLASIADIVMLNVTFVAFSIPIITIPACICAMSRISFELCSAGDDGKAVLPGEQASGLFRRFWQIFRAEFRRSLLLGAVFGLLNSVCIYILIILGGAEAGIAIKAFMLISLAAMLVMSFYVFALLPLLDLSPWQIVSDAFVLLLAELPRNVLSVIVYAALNLLIFVLFPFSFPFFICTHFALLNYLMISIIKPGIRKCLDE